MNGALSLLTASQRPGAADPNSAFPSFCHPLQGSQDSAFSSGSVATILQDLLSLLVDVLIADLHLLGV